MVDKNRIDRLLNNLRDSDTGTVNSLTGSRVATDHEVPALKKMYVDLERYVKSHERH